MVDLTYLNWAHARSSSGTAGTFLKSEEAINGKKIYYKLSNFDPLEGVVGHECVNEIIVDRLLNILEVDHIHYELIDALIEIEGVQYQTYLCRSEDFKAPGESKASLDNYFAMNSIKGENHYDFCKRMGWDSYINTMIAVDFIILNRDRHGANIEVLRNSRLHTIKLAPLFDHGLSLLYSCRNDSEADAYDVTEDKRCQNFIGGQSCFDNLSLIGDVDDRRSIFKGSLKETDKTYIFDGLEDILSSTFIDKIWEMIYTRYCTYENL